MRLLVAVRMAVEVPFVRRHASVSQSRRRAGADHDGVELGDFALGRRQAELSESYVEAPYEFLELPGVSHWIP